MKNKESKLAWFTSVNLLYLDRAAVLAETMKQIHKEWTSVLLLVDEMPNRNQCSDLLKDFDLILVPENLDFGDFSTWNKSRQRDILSTDASTWLAQHSVTEACTAVKPFGFKKLMQEFEYVFYLDPDVAVFDNLAPAVNPLLSGSSLILTPHQLEPETDFQAIIDNEIGTLRTGLYNFGFLGVNSHHPEASKFIDFWAERLKYFCIEDACSGLHTDQKWGNFAPIFFNEVEVSRHPGLNVASWNISKRNLHVTQDGKFLVNNNPLIFYHFSQAKNVGQIMAERYSYNNAAVADIWRWYLARLNYYGKFVPTSKWKYKK
jgi:hypothetical protein